MKLFADTSTLLKKYIDEKATDEFLDFLENISQIIIAPVTVLEVRSAIARRVWEKSITLPKANWVLEEFHKDYRHFKVVQWNDKLVEYSIGFIQDVRLKILDSVQLAAGILSSAEIFATSDKKLHAAAMKHSLESMIF